MGLARFAIAAVAALASFSAAAQTTPYQEYDRLVKANEMVSPLGSELFGDNVGLYNGSTEFTVSDIDIPGNNSLPVRLGRTFKVELRNDADSLGGFGAWDIEVPYITGVFPAGGKWNVSGMTTLPRCSAPFFPDVSAPFHLNEVWTGTQVHVPGRGTQTMMWNGNSGNPQPTDGQSYYWNTRDQMRFRCTSMLNYAGEGFIGVDSAGVKYFFNYAIERAGGVVRKSASGWGEVAANRFKIYLVATRVEDRFGNYVNYTYQGDRLVQISSSDQRVIDLTYTDGRITKATAHGREWQYTYSPTQYFSIHQRAKVLTSVTLPDQSNWQYQYQGTLQLDPVIQDSATGDMRCIEPLPNYGGFGLQAKHPSGAVGNFSFAYQRHGISGTPASACVLEAVIGGVQHWSLVIPDYFYNFALATKQISGPGLETMQWQYAYGEPLTGRANYGGLYCTTCDDEKSVWVTNPDGTKDEYVFGVLFNFNDGRLLGKYRRQADNKIVRAELTEYVTTAEAASMPFPGEIGYLHGAFDYTTGYNRPVKKTTILQDGDITGPVEFVPPPPDPWIPPGGGGGCVPEPPNYTCEQPTALPGGPVALMSAATSSSTSGVPATAFFRQVNTFDVYARPVSVTLSNTMAGTVAKTEVTTYHDNPTRWVLGQVAQLTVNGTVASETTFDSLASPATYKAFGKLKQTLTYNTDGTVATVKDGNNNVTTLSNWKRGIPQAIKHPATPEAPSGATESAVVSDNGWITSITDENSYKTCYSHDPAGRLSKIWYPSETVLNTCDGSLTQAHSVWAPTAFYFQQVASAEYGIPAGHWRMIVWKGNYKKTTYLDALWRPVVVQEEDAANAQGTLRWSVTHYDHDGRVTYASYPRNPFVQGWSNYSDTPPGIWTAYDALGRTTSVSQDSEHNLLTTLTEYLPNLTTRTTNPRGVKTVTYHQAFDQPTYAAPISYDVAVDLPERSITEIFRDVFGKPALIRKRNASGSLQIDRRYKYDEYQQLCKVVEPETGATVMDYDGGDNVVKSASGLTSPLFLDINQCHRVEAWASGRAWTRSYDARNRLKTLAFPDGSGNQAWTYTPDGLTATITTHNSLPTVQDGQQVINAYAYNRRRLMVGESVTQKDWYAWGVGYGYDTNASLATQSYYDGSTLSYQPNALGQPTRVQDHSGFVFASGAQYYPNGAIKQFTYGNGIVHSMTQNTRQLPARSVDAGVLDLDTRFDANGNVSDIYDVQRGAFYNRHMQYDGLDRLTAAGSWVFGGDAWHRYTYNAVDNMTSWKLPGVKDYAQYVYSSRNRLANIKDSGGATIVALEYDDQGNLDNKSSQNYDFDIGNRLREVSGKEYYRYDGHGRRVMAWRPGVGSVLSQYTSDGKVFFQWDEGQNKRLYNIYLGNSVVAIREVSIDGSSYATKYQHTDALGSPVAVTDVSGAVIERNDYEPYGAVVGKPNYQGIGYTGHVQDGATKLTYMQQRYYDPQVGLFLSVDPVAAHSDPVGQFHRYRYANNNPYRFNDPDGRYVCEASKEQCAAVSKAVRDIKSSMRSSIAGGLSERWRVGAVERTLGKEGHDNGVTIKAGPDGMTSAGTAETRDGRTTLTINFDGLGSALRMFPGFSYQSLITSTLFHEGSHGFEQRMRQRKGLNPMTSSRSTLLGGERRAYRGEAMLFRGLAAPHPWGLWTPAGGVNEAEIEAQSQESVKQSCGTGLCTP